MIFRRKCWHLWGFWFYVMEDMELQWKRCLKCDKRKVRRVPRYIKRVTV